MLVQVSGSAIHTCGTSDHIPYIHLSLLHMIPVSYTTGCMLAQMSVWGIHTCGTSDHIPYIHPSLLHMIPVSYNLNHMLMRE